MNNKWSTLTVGVVAVGALAVGLAVPKISPLVLGHKKAEIRATARMADGTYKCQQWSGGSWTSLNPYKFPPLDKGSFGDKIRWRGKDLSGNRIDVTVQFSKSPFAKTQYGDDEETSTIDSGVAQGDYSFSAVTLGGTSCLQYEDPGVHVN